MLNRVVTIALGFVRGSTYVLLVHAMFAPSARGIDVTKIAAAKASS